MQDPELLGREGSFENGAGNFSTDGSKHNLLWQIRNLGNYY